MPRYLSHKNLKTYKDCFLLNKYKMSFLSPSIIMTASSQAAFNSEVWQLFTVFNNQNKTTCSICKPELSFRHGSMPCMRKNNLLCFQMTGTCVEIYYLDSGSQCTCMLFVSGIERRGPETYADHIENRLCL